MKKKRLILITLIVIAVIILGYYIFFYSKKCDSAACFASAQLACSKAYYIDDGEDATWKYSVKGQNKDSCVVNVELSQAKKGNIELEKLQNLKMDCYLPLRYTGNPQSDLSKCHGLLKEEMQDLIIKKLHAYIVSNLGKISEELTKAL